MFKLTPLASAAALALVMPFVHAEQAANEVPVATVATAATETTASPTTPSPELGRIEIKATRQRLDEARSSLSPETGSTIYRFDKADIAKLPLGDATPLNQLLLRAPGMVGDSNSQLHVRGDHGNLQYRINGVVIPESISGFGQALDTRFADQVNVLSGALPAQYGYRTAGVVDIRTKGADLANGGSVDVVLGSRGHREASVNVGGTSGNFQYFGTGSYLQNQIGIENPTPSSHALHDDTRQTKGFAYLSYLLGANSRVSLMLASANGRFQIPNVLGRSPSFTLAGTPPPDSRLIDSNQRERNTFQVLTFQSSLDGGVDYQVSLFNRNSSVHYRPDPIGDLIYTGVAAFVVRENAASGLQFDLSRRLNAQHTLRAGLFLQHERGSQSNVSTLFTADSAGNQTSTVPLTITDSGQLSSRLFGLYLQDEWKPTAALTVNYGLRYDRVDTAAAIPTEAQFSPRLGLVYQLGHDTRVHAGYARYFSPPPSEKIDATSVQKFAGTTNAAPTDANSPVVSERSHYIDLGISHQLTPRITLGADAYYRRVQHMQDEGQFGSAQIYSAFNYAQGKVYGLELSGSYKDERLSAYANLSINSTNAKGIESGQFTFDADVLDYVSSHWVHPDHSQAVSASVGVSYRFGARTVVGGDLLYGSGLRSGFANTEHLPAFVQVNASVLQGFDLNGAGKFNVRLSAINLLDRSYQLHDSSSIGVGAPQFAPRRTFYVALSKPFTF